MFVYYVTEIMFILSHQYNRTFHKMKLRIERIAVRIKDEIGQDRIGQDRIG